MAKNKKRKKKAPSAVHAGSVSSFKITKTYFVQFCTAARKIFQTVGVDPALFDIFSKPQKHAMCLLQMTYPRLCAMKEGSVPRHYLKYLQSEIYFLMQKSMFDKEAELSLMDMILFGITFFGSLSHILTTLPLSEQQHETLTLVQERSVEKDLINNAIGQFVGYLRTSLLQLSQPNFRIYGFDLEPKTVRPPRITAYIVSIVVKESESKKFTYNNIERIGYRLMHGRVFETDFTGATIELHKLYPNARNNPKLNLYIQSHALRRFKERVDTIIPLTRNQTFSVSTMSIQQIVRDAKGRPLMAAVMPPDSVIGYFTFSIHGDDMLIQTFLPLTSPDVPEGKILCERLNLSKEDLKHLGMDKLSFFYDVDIEQIPALKKVLYDEIGLGYIRTLYTNLYAEVGYVAKDESVKEKRTQFVKNFFDKAEAYGRENPLPEDEEKEAGQDAAIDLPTAAPLETKTGAALPETDTQQLSINL
jgi:hypothetical protein